MSLLRTTKTTPIITVLMLAPTACVMGEVSENDDSRALRYGQADVRFTICPGDNPGDWERSINVWPNGTASLQGYDFVNEEIHTTGGGDYYRFYTATFKLQDCVPYVGWPCTIRGTFAMDFYAWSWRAAPE
jgi:hypothetical protein